MFYVIFNFYFDKLYIMLYVYYFIKVLNLNLQLLFYIIGIITSESLNKYTTIINLFAIQPKSIQEGQLIISSPEISIQEQFGEKNMIKPNNQFPKPPSLNSHNNTTDIAKNNIPGKNNLFYKLAFYQLCNFFTF